MSEEELKLIKKEFDLLNEQKPAQGLRHIEENIIKSREHIFIFLNLNYCIEFTDPKQL